MTSQGIDVLIVGRRIIGLCISSQLTQRDKSLSITVLDKEESLLLPIPVVIALTYMHAFLTSHYRLKLTFASLVPGV